VTRDMIYLVTEGEYSDYRVLCAYPDEASADAAVANGVGEQVEAFPLLATGSMPRKVSVWRAVVRVLRPGGRVELVDPWSDEVWDFTEPVRFAVEEYPNHTVFRGTSKGRVVRAAQDRAVRLRAEAAGVA
jgi:hypothetical protein